MHPKILLASKNEGKIAEFYHLLNGDLDGQEAGQSQKKINPERNWQILSLRDFPEMPDVDETGTTFIENALLKAREISLFSHLPALSDDSGLSIDALDGRPGVYSARYTGEHGNAEANMNKVLAELADVAPEKRMAHFTCVVALVIPTEIISAYRISLEGKSGINLQPNGDCEIVREGTLHGHIGFEPRGSYGFGYDPIFIPVGDERTLAEYRPEEKKLISHRAQAMAAMEQEIKRIFP